MGPVGARTPGHYYTTLDDWPTTTTLSYYFHSSSSILSLNPPTLSGETSWEYDPSTPSPTHPYGGHNLGGTCGPVDQRPLESRDDWIVFTTPVLTSQLSLVGMSHAILYVSSSANDTDFVVKITDVYPDGTARLLTEASFRMKSRESITEFSPIQPGMVYEIDIEIWSTAIVLPPGHALRVMVGSSNYERWSRSPNTFIPVADDNGSLLFTARNTLHTSPSQPSRIEFPSVSPSQIPPMDLGFLGDLVNF